MILLIQMASVMAAILQLDTSCISLTDDNKNKNDMGNYDLKLR